MSNVTPNITPICSIAAQIFVQQCSNAANVYHLIADDRSDWQFPMLVPMASYSIMVILSLSELQNVSLLRKREEIASTNESPSYL